MGLYRVYPVLMSEKNEYKMIYVIDRDAPNIRTMCAKLVKEDPAYVWNGGVVKKILPFDATSVDQYITWETLTQWLSDAENAGYTIKNDFTHLKPYSDIYLHN
jgi:hypothetical protein